MAAVEQKIGVVHIGIFRRVVEAKTGLLYLIVPFVHGFAFPVFGAFDAKVVFGFAGQFAIAKGRLMDALGQGDAGRNAAALHLLNGDVFVLSNVFLHGPIGCFRLCPKQGR